jgi:hypothetical protein
VEELVEVAQPCGRLDPRRVVDERREALVVLVARRVVLAAVDALLDVVAAEAVDLGVGRAQNRRRAGEEPRAGGAAEQRRAVEQRLAGLVAAQMGGGRHPELLGHETAGRGLEDLVQGVSHGPESTEQMVSRLARRRGIDFAPAARPTTGEPDGRDCASGRRHRR